MLIAVASASCSKNSSISAPRMPMLVAVAGASGRLGRCVVASLAKNGYSVLALVRSKPPAGVFPKGVSCKIVSYGQDNSGLKTALEGTTHIINLTGSTSSYLPEAQLRDANVGATKKLLESAPSSLEKFVHISSISVYGKRLASTCTETSPRNADTAYARTKLEAENIVLSYKNRFNIVILQPAMIYGSGFTDGFYPILKRIFEGKMKIIGDGSNHIPLVHSQDVCSAIISSLKRKLSSGSTYLLVHEPQLTQAQLFSIASSSLGVNSPVLHQDASQIKFAIGLNELYCKLFSKKPKITLEMAEQLCSDRRFNSKKANEELCWKCAIPFKTGIAQVVSEFLEYNRRGN